MVLDKNSESMKKRIVSTQQVSQRGTQLSRSYATKIEFWKFVVLLALNVGSLGLRSQVVQQTEPLQSVQHLCGDVSSGACNIRHEMRTAMITLCFLNDQRV